MSNFVYNKLNEGETYRVDEIVDEHPEVVLDCINNGKLKKADNEILVDEDYLKKLTSFDYKKPSDYARKFDQTTDWLMEIIGSAPPLSNLESRGFDEVEEKFGEKSNSRVHREHAEDLASKNRTLQKVGKYGAGLGGITMYLTEEFWIGLGGTTALIGGPLLNRYSKGKERGFNDEAVKGWDQYTRGEFRNWEIKKDN